MSKRVAILQSNYLPWKGYLDLIHNVDAFVFYDEAKYTKNDWRNRNRICARDGVHWLTIPVSKESVHLKISEVRVDDKPWQELHFKTLTQTYRRAPHYSQLHDLIEPVLAGRKWTHLSELNQTVIRQISKNLGIQTEFYNSADLPMEGGRIERLLSILRELKATEYYTGQKSRDYLAGQEHLFSEAGIDLHFKETKDYPPYPQLAEPFFQSVSVVDMIAHLSYAEIPHYIWGWREG